MRLARPIWPEGTSRLLRARVHQRLDLGFRLVGELVALGVEQLDAVVGEGIVRGGDHDAEIGSQRAREHGHGGRGHRPQQEDVHAHGGEARHQGRLDHVAREPRVLADHHAVRAPAAVGEQLAGRHADAERDLRGHGQPVGEAADAVGAEVLARHGMVSLRSGDGGLGGLGSQRQDAASGTESKAGRCIMLPLHAGPYQNP